MILSIETLTCIRGERHYLPKIQFHFQNPIHEIIHVECSISGDTSRDVIGDVKSPFSELFHE